MSFLSRGCPLFFCRALLDGLPELLMFCFQGKLTIERCEIVIVWNVLDLRREAGFINIKRICSQTPKLQNTPKVFLLTRNANKLLWCFKQFFNSLNYLLEKWQILCHTYAFPEINRAGNVRLVRYSLLHPLAGNVHRDTRTFTGCFASTRLFRVKMIRRTVSTVV